MSDLSTLAARAAEALTTLEKQGQIASRWLSGMQTDDGHLYSPAEGWPNRPWVSSIDGARGRHRAADRPNLSDPLTVLALLQLVREAAGVPDLHTFRGRNVKAQWYWGVGDLASHDRAHLGTGSSEAEALVVALERLARGDV